MTRVANPPPPAGGRPPPPPPPPARTRLMSPGLDTDPGDLTVSDDALLLLRVIADHDRMTIAAALDAMITARARAIGLPALTKAAQRGVL